MPPLPRAVSAALLTVCAPLSAQTEPQPPPADDLPARLQAALAAAREQAGVPGVSAAVVRGGRIVWSAGVGVRQRTADGASAPADNAIDEHTLFQAASISKPITAMAALRLCAEGQLELDTAIDRLPGNIAVARRADTGSAPPTLRRLLSHTAGTTVHGFPGYAPGTALPDLAAVIAGEGNTDAVVIDAEPGGRFRYSGGGYCVVQQLLVAAREQPFAALMKELVLEPLGMQESTFAQPLPERWTGRAARAHDGGGVPMDEPYFVYPEQAAAGLWTTARDLARALLAADAAAHGRDGALLPRPIAEQMLTAQAPAETYGLGWMVRREGARSMFGHGGSNQGFLCDARMLHDGDEAMGYVVMINSEQPDGLRKIVGALMAELRRRGGR